MYSIQKKLRKGNKGIKDRWEKGKTNANYKQTIWIITLTVCGLTTQIKDKNC